MKIDRRQVGSFLLPSSVILGFNFLLILAFFCLTNFSIQIKRKRQSWISSLPSIHSFSMHLLSTFFVLGTVLNTWAEDSGTCASLTWAPCPSVQPQMTVALLYLVHLYAGIWDHAFYCWVFCKLWVFGTAIFSIFCLLPSVDYSLQIYMWAIFSFLLQFQVKTILIEFIRLKQIYSYQSLIGVLRTRIHHSYLLRHSPEIRNLFSRPHLPN